MRPDVASLGDIKALRELTYNMYVEESPLLYYYQPDDYVTIYTAGSIYGYDKLISNTDVRYIVQDIIESEKEFSFYYKEILPLFTYSATTLAYNILNDKYLNDETEHLDERYVSCLKNILSDFISQNAEYSEDWKFYLEIVSTWLSCDDNLVSTACKLIEHIGAHGFYALEYSMINNEEDIVHPIKGYSFYIPSMDMDFIQDAVNMETIIENPVVYLYDGSFNDIDAIRVIIDFVMRSGKKCVIIAGGYSDKVVLACKRLMNMNYAEIYPVVLPLSGSRLSDVLSDLAYITGAFILRPEYPVIEPSKLFGTCEGIVITKRVCSVVPVDNALDRARQRASAIRALLPEISDIETKVFMSERAAKLEGQVAIVSIGGKHRINREFRRDKFIRTISFVQNAIQAGTIKISKIHELIKRLSSQKGIYTYTKTLSDVIETTTQKFQNNAYPAKSLDTWLKRLLDLYARWYMVEHVVKL